MSYQRSMSETLSDRNNQPMLVWNQGVAASADNAKFHVLGRLYSYSSLTDLSEALEALLNQIKDYHSDLAAGFIDKKGIQTKAGQENQLRIDNIQENSDYFS